jgi:hypothetical protein
VYDRYVLMWKRCQRVREELSLSGCVCSVSVGCCCLNYKIIILRVIHGIRISRGRKKDGSGSGSSFLSHQISLILGMNHVY